jgi:hypothetical protein
MRKSVVFSAIVFIGSILVELFFAEMGSSPVFGVPAAIVLALIGSFFFGLWESGFGALPKIFAATMSAAMPFISLGVLAVVLMAIQVCCTVLGR